jgi:hypothetical protein
VGSGGEKQSSAVHATLHGWYCSSGGERADCRLYPYLDAVPRGHHRLQDGLDVVVVDAISLQKKRGIGRRTEDRRTTTKD